MKKRHVNMGICSILGIFIILSLITFGLICLRVSKLNYDRSERLALQTTNYYNADLKGEQYLEGLLLNENLQDGFYEDYIELNDRQSLHVALQVTDGIMTVKDWTVEGKSMEIDTRQPVMIFD